MTLHQKSLAALTSEQGRPRKENVSVLLTLEIDKMEADVVEATSIVKRTVDCISEQRDAFMQGREAHGGDGLDLYDILVDDPTEITRVEET